MQTSPLELDALRELWRRFGRPALIGGLLIVGAAIHGQEPSPDGSVTPQSVSEWILAQSNAFRREQSRAELAKNPALELAAQTLANEIARTGQLSHQADGRTPAQRIEAQQYRWRFVAENIAFRSDVADQDQDTAAQLTDQWKASPGHRRNLLAMEPTEIGVATARGADGSIYAVQVFAAPWAP